MLKTPKRKQEKSIAIAMEVVTINSATVFERNQHSSPKHA
jgi:hypothetical protein